MKDVGVQQRGRERHAASLVVDAEFLSLGDKAPESHLGGTVSLALVPEEVLQVDAAVRSRLVEGNGALLEELHHEGPRHVQQII